MPARIDQDEGGNQSGLFALEKGRGGGCSTSSEEGEKKRYSNFYRRKASEAQKILSDFGKKKPLLFMDEGRKGGREIAL